MVYTDPDTHLSFITRAFNGQIPGPTLRVFPGDTLVVTLKNNLQNTPILTGREFGLSATSEFPSQSFVAPIVPNATNLHTHGLHVSPKLGSDNVLDVKVNPGESFTYTYEIPYDHMPGTFWYHPHLTGAEALQIGGGASGFLIVDDPPAAIQGYPKWLRDLDTREHEQLVNIQHIPLSALKQLDDRYTARGFSGVLNASGLPKGWDDGIPRLGDNQYRTTDGGFRDYARIKRAAAEGEAPGNAGTVMNTALVNGRVAPAVRVRSGEWRRWRFLYTGPFYFLDLSFEPESKAGSVSPEDAQQPRCEMQLLAKDGIYLQMMPRLVDRLILPPAGRADVAIRCTGKGQLRLVSGARPGRSGEWNEDLFWHPNLAVIEVEGGDHTDSGGSKDRDAAPLTTEGFAIPRPTYLHDLKELPQSKVDGTFDMDFVNEGNFGQKYNARSSADPNYKVPGVDDGPVDWNNALWDGATLGCSINGHAYERGAPMGRWKVNTVQEWTVTGLVEHPLHLHVNPFQVSELSGGAEAKRQVQIGGSIGSGQRKTAEMVCDLEYGYTCVGDWLDTLMLPTKDASRFKVVSDSSKTSMPSTQFGPNPVIVDTTKAKFRFVTDRFTGHEVMHCHYSNHADLGCLSYFEIEE